MLEQQPDSLPDQFTPLVDLIPRWDTSLDNCQNLLHNDPSNKGLSRIMSAAHLITSVARNRYERIIISGQEFTQEGEIEVFKWYRKLGMDLRVEAVVMALERRKNGDTDIQAEITPDRRTGEPGVKVRILPGGLGQYTTHLDMSKFPIPQEELYELIGQSDLIDESQLPPDPQLY